MVLVLALLEIAAMVLSWRRNQRLMSGSLQAQADTQSYAYEMLAGIETLKASGAEHRAVEHWGDLFIDQLNIDLTRGRLSAAVDSVMGTLQIASPLVILMVGAFQVLAGHMSLGTMLSAAALGAGFLEPLATMVTSGLQLQHARQLHGAHQRRPRHPARAARRARPARAPAQRPDPGRRRVVLLRPARPAGGQRRLAGDPARASTSASSAGPARGSRPSRTCCSACTGRHPGASCTTARTSPTSTPDRSAASSASSPSARTCSASSIRENIALTDPELPLEAVVEAARIACVHDDIVAMPMGYDTRLHDGGASVSGGQRQRIALARALVHRPSILLLDEATSALDTVTEQKIYTNLDAISSTTIVIAHRLSTIRNADLILVMDEGRIVETGTHEQLLSRQGRTPRWSTPSPSAASSRPPGWTGRQPIRRCCGPIAPSPEQAMRGLPVGAFDRPGRELITCGFTMPEHRARVLVTAIPTGRLCGWRPRDYARPILVMMLEM